MQGNFEDIIGLDEHKQFFERLLSRKKMPGAILLSGPPMVGKKKLLRETGKPLLCDNYFGCGKCSSCQTNFSAHPDIIQPENESGEKRRKQLIKLVSRAYQKPVLSPRLLVFLPDLDKYSFEALSLLLKTLEDAPPAAHFFMTASSEHRIPQTILSRAVTRIVNPMPAAKLAAQLQKREMIVQEAEKYAVLAGGRPGLALRLAKDGELKKQYQEWYKYLSQLSRTPLKDRIKMADSIADKENAAEVLLLLQGMLRESVRAAVKRGKPEQLRSLTPFLRRSREAVAMLESYVPPRLTLEYIFFTS